MRSIGRPPHSAGTWDWTGTAQTRAPPESASYQARARPPPPPLRQEERRRSSRTRSTEFPKQQQPMDERHLLLADEALDLDAVQEAPKQETPVPHSPSASAIA